MTNSPMICIFAYKRPGHFEQTLDALERNQGASELPLTIYIDGPRDPADRQAVASVLEVARKPRLFKTIEIVERSANLGLYKSLTQGITEVLTTNESVIVLEDDIKTSPFFIQYMLDGLRVFKNAMDVASIHGYTPPIATELPETFFLRGADCWGWATWRDRWDLFRHDAGNMSQEIRNRGLTYEFNLNGNYDYLGMLDCRASGRNNSWAICWHASCFLANKLTLYPGKSLVRNIGLDNTGEHCGPSSLMASDLFLNPIMVSPVPVAVVPSVHNAYCNHFSANTYSKSALFGLLRRKLKSLKDAVTQSPSSGLHLKGPFLTYKQALDYATGYNNPTILEKVREAIIDVLEGRGTYERDGTVFDKPPANLMIRHILEVYLQPDSLVVDFGGGLGGTFINHADLFNENQRCVVIEQENFAEEGHKLVTDKGLNIDFLLSFDVLNESPDIVIFSSVLQYIPDVTKVLLNAIKLRPRLILLDRTAFQKKGPWYWWVQQEDTYYKNPISYPIRPLDESKVLATLQGYRAIARWSNRFDPQQPAHRGLLLQRCS